MMAVPSCGRISNRLPFLMGGFRPLMERSQVKIYHRDHYMQSKYTQPYSRAFWSHSERGQSLRRKRLITRMTKFVPFFLELVAVVDQLFFLQDPFGFLAGNHSLSRGSCASFSSCVL